MRLKTALRALVLAGSGWAGHAIAAEPAGVARPADAAGQGVQGARWMPVTENRLASLRGGFDSGGGLVMSLGITRSVIVNGNVLSATTMNIADMSHLSAEQAGQASNALGAFNLVQNGPGNVFLAGPMGQAGTVLQNTLNDQLLHTQTVINSTLNSAELLKNMNFQGSVRDALSGGLGPR